MKYKHKPRAKATGAMHKNIDNYTAKNTPKDFRDTGVREYISG
jgi:hypothetical protein